MKKIAVMLMAGFFFLGVAGTVLADPASDATDLVGKAIAYYKANGLFGALRVLSWPTAQMKS